MNDSITWTSSNSLTLLAKRNIEINNGIDGYGDISFYAGWSGASTTSPAVTSGVGDITAANCCRTVQTRGNIHFEAGRDILLPSIQVRAGYSASDSAAKSAKLIAGRNISLTSSDGASRVRADGNNGSAATVRLEAKSGSVTVQDSSEALAYGGAEGGEGGGVGGGAATVTVIAGNGINVTSSSNIAAYGGSGSGAKGGAAAVSLSAVGGSIQIDGAEGATAQGGSGTTTGNATIAMVSAGDIVVKQNNSTSPQIKAKANSGTSPGTALVVLSAAGNVSLSSATIDSTGGVGLGGNNIALNNGTISAGGGVIFTAKNNLDVVNNSNVTGSGILNIGAGGNVLVDKSKLSGSPDVVMKVGGTVRINGTLATPGSISAVSSQTIYLTFPTGLGGGFFINGIEGVVYDSATNTGFFAGGSAAVLGSSFRVTYGGLNSLLAPTDALIVAMGESGKPPDPNKDKDVFKDAEDEEKDAPVCR